MLQRKPQLINLSVLILVMILLIGRIETQDCSTSATGPKYDRVSTVTGGQCVKESDGCFKGYNDTTSTTLKDCNSCDDDHRFDRTSSLPGAQCVERVKGSCAGTFVLDRVSTDTKAECKS
jgi:hypothetical protein